MIIGNKKFEIKAAKKSNIKIPFFGNKSVYNNFKLGGNADLDPIKMGIKNLILDYGTKTDIAAVKASPNEISNSRISNAISANPKAIEEYKNITEQFRLVVKNYLSHNTILMKQDANNPICFEILTSNIDKTKIFIGSMTAGTIKPLIKS